LDLPNPNDDLKREAAFYQRALQNAKQGLEQLLHYQVPFRRPADYFAEMVRMQTLVAIRTRVGALSNAPPPTQVKSDSHMAKVKASLIAERQRMDAVAERKRRQEHKKFAKQAYSAKLQQRAKEKRSQAEVRAVWRISLGIRSHCLRAPHRPSTAGANQTSPRTPLGLRAWTIFSAATQAALQYALC
jgi:rRNA-processing protein EBP2